MTIIKEIDFERFEPWSGAVDTWERIREEGKLDLLEQILDDTYCDRDTMTDTELNDLLWFEPETVYHWLGMKTDDEIYEEQRARKEMIAALTRLKEITDASEFCDCWTGDCDQMCYNCPLYSIEEGDCGEDETLATYHDRIVEAADGLIKELEEEDT